MHILLKLTPALIIEGNFRPDSGSIAAKILLDKRKVYFDGIVAANDMMALGAIDMLLKRGIAIPRDVSVVGFDNISHSEFKIPPITTVKQPLYEEGRTAASLALSRANGFSVQDIISLPTELIVRQSCGCLPQSIIHLAQEITSKPSNLSVNTPLFDSDGLDFSLLELPFSQDNNAEFSRIVELLLRYIKDDSLTEEKLYQLILPLQNLFVTEISNNHNLSTLPDTLINLQQWISSHLTDEKHRSRSTLLLQMVRLLIIEWMRIQETSSGASYYNNLATLSYVTERLVPMSRFDDLLELFYRELPILDIKSCFIFFYPKSLIHRNEDLWKMPKQTKLIFAYNQNGPIPTSELESVYYNTSDFVPWELLLEGERKTLILSTLHHMEEQLGFILYEPGINDGLVYETITSQISGLLKNSLLMTNYQKADHKLRSALKKLQFYNQHLNKLSQTDDMTGLYNRRGFMNLARQSLQLSISLKNSGILFFADLDGLKTINDRHGHKAGDQAILAAADSLKKSFRHMDIISRLGGDEFVILAIDTPEDFTDKVRKRLKKNITLINSTGKHPFELSISIGWVPFLYDENPTIEQLIAMADARLYEQKQHNKSRLPDNILDATLNASEK